MTNSKNLLQKAANKYGKRAFCYVRVAEKNDALVKEHIYNMERYCHENGIELMKSFTDNGHSGINMDRPALQEMICELKNGDADMVLTLSVSMLTRSIHHMVYLNDVFEKEQVHFRSINDWLDTSTAQGKLMLHMLSCSAEAFEELKVKEYVK